ncbi:MAG: CPBP family intramembrane metalloprotease [Tissierellia bacterium]|nr:CPBP family intramembrane metalloprotease [Tissierellia bacterium]
MKNKIVSILKLIGILILLQIFMLAISSFISLILLKNVSQTNYDKAILGYNGLILAISSTIFILIMIFIFRRNRKKKKKEIIKFNTVNKTCLISSIILILSANFYMYVYSLLISNISFLEDIFKKSIESYNTNMTLNLEKASLSMLFYVIILAPILEELIYRAYCSYKLEDNFSKRSIIIITAILFALAHANLFQSFGVFVTGIVLAIVYLNTHSISLTIFCHMLNNIIATITEQSFFNEYLTILYVIITFICVFLTKKAYKNLKDNALIYNVENE